jgi:hypothetical protein
MTAGRISVRYSEVVEQQPENGLALAPGPTQALGDVIGSSKAFGVSVTIKV